MDGLALFTMPAYNKTFDVIAWALKTFTPTEGGYLAFNVVGQAVAALIMIPTTFCAGMTLPLLTQALRRRSGEKAIGAVYASNTLGAIVGVIAAVHIGMPLAGVKGVIVAGAVIHMALGFSGLLLTREARSTFRFASAAICTLLLVGVASSVTLDPLRLTSGVYRSGVAVRDSDAEVRYLRHGKTATISVVQLPDGLVSIATNGKPDAAIQMGEGPIARDERTMIFAAALPLSMHASPRRVANIGFGSGLTSHVLLTSDEVERLDSIEIEPFMVEGAKLAYFPRVRRVFEDPRSNIVYEDAKTFFATSREPYDVIVSEPSNPWVSGVATLFSDEFYRRIVGYLRQDGYFVQWLQIYETDMSIVASVIKAMSPHFGDYAIYNADDTNVMIIATPAGKLQRPSEVVFESAALKEELERMGVHSVADIERRRIADKPVVDALMHTYGSPANSDFFPFVDLNAPRLRFMRASAGELTRMMVLPVPVVELLAGHVLHSSDSHAPSNSDLERDLFTRRGNAVRSALQVGTINDIDLAVATSVMVVSASGELCNDAGARATWSEAVHRISLSTSAFLSPGELDPIWQRIKGSSCYRGMSERGRAWPVLLEAVARRDLEAIAQSGHNVLASRAWEPSSDKHAYALTATAAALLRLGRHVDAQQLMERESGTLSPASEYKLALRTLAALSAARARGSEGSVSPTRVTSVN
jgi:spermidine synthase